MNKIDCKENGFKFDDLLPESKSCELILACGGKSERMGRNKLLMDIGGKPCILRSCEPFDMCVRIKSIIIAAPEELQKTYSELLKSIKKPIRFVKSGATRQQSVMNAAEASHEDIIIIHDGARPFVTLDLIERSIDDAYLYGSSIAASPVKDTIRYFDGESSYSPDRSCLYAVKTPQTFSRKLYLYAAHRSKGDYTDDAQLLDAVGIAPHITLCDASNIKITSKEDIAMAEGLMKKSLRIGHGYDVHRLTEGRKLILGGELIPFEKGLLGHSDADAATHALIDSLLGAAALGDIGKLFPDSDEKYRDADSIELLKKVVGLLRENGCKIVNSDITITAQRPKLSPYIDAIRNNLASAMGIPYESVSVKATTEEGLGFTGSGEGIAAHAVSLLEKYE